MKKILFSVGILFVIGLELNFSAKAQSMLELEQLLQERTPSSPYQPMTRKVSFMKSKSNSKIAKYNPVRLTFVGLMYTYQRFLSAQFAAECPYEISCSNFSKAVIARYGLLKGIALSADRLMRCNEFLKYDLTPVNLTKDNHLIDPVEDYHF